MPRLIPTWRVAARHGRSNWRILMVLAAGILVAAVLLSSAPIYSRAMADLGLTFTIREELEGRAGVNMEIHRLPLGSADGMAVREAVETRIDERLGWFRESQSRYSGVARLRQAKTGGPFVDGTPALHLQSQQGYEAHVNILSGTLPRKAVPGQPIEVAMSQRIANVAGLKVGDAFDMLEDFDTCAREIPEGDVPPPPPPCDAKVIVRWRLPATLVGIIEPSIEDDPFWAFTASQMFEPERPVNLPGEGPNLAVFVHEETLLDTYAALFPAYREFARWVIFADPEALSRRNFGRALTDLEKLDSEVEPFPGYVYGPLEQTLGNFRKTATFQQTPLTILLLQIAAVALFYTALVAATVVERQGQEITLFRSRGASTWQIASIYLFEGLYLAVPIVLVAPFLAAAATSLLGFTPLFNDVTNGDLLPVSIPPISFAMAALGAALGIAALLLPVIAVAMRGALAHRRGQSRPGVSFIQRYYLDLVFAALAGLLLWELNEKGSAFEPSATGGVSSDPVLLASPALIISAVAALILRFYPMVLRLVSRLIAYARAFTLTMSVWQLSRSPGQYTRLALLLMMAIAVGTYAASYSSTAERSYNDRANFLAGTDARAFPSATSRFGFDPKEAEKLTSALPGVQRVSAVYRSNGEIASAGGSGLAFQLLGVEPSAVDEMLWFRSDFADRPLDELLLQLEGPTQLKGKPIPGDPDSIFLWVNPPEGASTTTVSVRLRDSKNNEWTVYFEEVGQPGWNRLSVPIKTKNLFIDFAPPYAVLALTVFEPPNARRGAQKPLLIDDLGVRDVGGNETIVDGFEDQVGWSVLPTRNAIPDEFVTVADKPHSGKQAGKYTYSAITSQIGVQGIYPQDALAPLSVIASKSFSDSTGILPGGTGLIAITGYVVPITVRANYNLFPTMPASDGPSMVFNRDQLFAWINTFAITQPGKAEEMWFDLTEDADREVLFKQLAADPIELDRSIDRADELRKVKSNPLIVAGGTGILVVSFIAVLGLVGAAMLVSLWTAVQRRRVEFAVLRALGTSSGQIFRVLTLEYSVVVGVGLLGGAYLGLFVARRMLSFLNVDTTGDRVEPAFILQTDWPFVLASCGLVLAVFVVAMLFAVRQVSRTTDAQALRTE